MIKPIPTLKNGIALLLIGPPGCGKSTLARRLARSAGTFYEFEMSMIGSRFGFGQVLGYQPKTLVIDGAPHTDRQLELLKLLLTNPVTTIPRKHAEPISVPRPNVIVCVQDADQIDHLQDLRRFESYRMPATV